MSIAGLDPSAGAGLFADLKCFEQHKVYGFGISSAITVQSDSDFINVEWVPLSTIIEQIAPLIRKFPIIACKIGLIESREVLSMLIDYLKSVVPSIEIVLDPILKASAGFQFHTWGNDLIPILKSIRLITPNYSELEQMGGSETEATARNWAEYTAVLLKGGHNLRNLGIDYLYEGKLRYSFKPITTELPQKHGSGCVLSSSIVANLALGHTLPDSCKNAKEYTTHFLTSNQSLLGYHS